MRNRRLLAKLIDLVAFAGFLSLGHRLGGSEWTGFALGAAYLLAGDALGMSSKAWFGLAVVDATTGRRCSLSASALRNTPWLAAPLFRTAITVFSGDTSGVAGLGDGVAAPPAVTIARGIVGMLGIGIALSLWRGLGDGSGRHWADMLAGTKVAKAGAPVTSTIRPRPGVTRAAPKVADEDKDAVDFDDADDDGTPKRRPPARGRTGKDKDAVDFDDAAN